VSSETKMQILEDIEIEVFAQSDVGVVDAMSALANLDHCFGKEYTPDSICIEECNATCFYKGVETRISDLCKSLCSAGATVADNARRLYREGSGSYYVVKAILAIREGTYEQVGEKAESLAKVDGKSIKDPSNRSIRTLTTLRDDGKVDKSGTGKEAVYRWKEDDGT